MFFKSTTKIYCCFKITSSNISSHPVGVSYNWVLPAVGNRLQRAVGSHPNKSTDVGNANQLIPADSQLASVNRDSRTPFSSYPPEAMPVVV